MKNNLKKILCSLAILAALLLLPQNNIQADAAGSNLSNATYFSMGSTFNLGYFNSDQYYKFYLSKNSCVHFKVTTSSHSEKIWMYLRNSQGESIYIDSTDDPHNWGFQTLEYDYSLAAGTYYLELDPAYGTVSGRLKTAITYSESSSVKIAGQANQYLNRAIGFSVGNTLRGVHDDNNQYYRFTLSKRRTVTFSSYSASDGGYLYFSLYRGDGTYAYDVGSLSRSKKSSLYRITLNAGTYYLKVMGSSDCKAYRMSTSAPVEVGKVYGMKASSPASGKLRATWSRVNGDGYQVQYCRSSSFKYSKVYQKNIYGSYMTSYAAALTRGYTYYVRTRAFKTVNSKRYYGAWSAVKSTRIRY